MNLCTFPQRLRQAINSESVNSFARKCDIPESLLRKYVGGKSKPGMDNLIKMAQVAEINIEWLATGEGSMSLKDAPEWIQRSTIDLLLDIRALVDNAVIDTDTDGWAVRFDPKEVKDVEVELKRFVHTLTLKIFQHGSNNKESSPNIDLLQLVIEGIEEALDESNSELAPGKKAQLISAVYDLYSESGAKPEKEKVCRLVALAA